MPLFWGPVNNISPSPVHPFPLPSRLRARVNSSISPTHSTDLIATFGSWWLRNKATTVSCLPLLFFRFLSTLCFWLIFYFLFWFFISVAYGLGCMCKALVDSLANIFITSAASAPHSPPRPSKHPTPPSSAFFVPTAHARPPLPRPISALTSLASPWYGATPNSQTPLFWYGTRTSPPPLLPLTIRPQACERLAIPFAGPTACLT